MNFDEVIERRDTHSMKWDMMEYMFGVPAENGIAMWVADMDFKPPIAVNKTLVRMVEHGIHGYFGDEEEHKQAVCHWMQNRHNWTPAPEHVLCAHGLVNGTALCVQTCTQPGDGVILFTPVYHSFARTIKASQREVIESPLVNNDGRYEMDLAALAQNLRGHEKMMLLCSPHNPGGRIWTREELSAVAEFCMEHDLILVSDEIHHDLVYGKGIHTPMPLISDELQSRLIMLTAATKTFNIAGGLTGNVIIADDELRQRFRRTLTANGIIPNRFGIMLATAAYQHGASWLDELIPYLDANRQLLDKGLHAIPGFKSMAMESTYLSWVDFSDTGMTPDAMNTKVQDEAGIAVNHGTPFGTGGEYFLRFNFATPRVRVEEAIERMQKVFGVL